MYKSQELSPQSLHHPGVKVFDFKDPKKFQATHTASPDYWKGLDQSTKASLVHSSYFDRNDRAALQRRKEAIDTYHDSLKQTGYNSSEKPYITSNSNEIITFSTRGEEDINFRRPQTETVQRLEWSTMERDLPAWDKAIKMLAKSSSMDDDQFRVEMVPQISNLLLQESPLFQHLASGDIDVTANHRALNKTPFLHTFDVLMAVETEASGDNRERFFLRFHALFHDIGKTIIANNDHFQDHGAFSQSMLMEYAIRVWKMSTVEAYQITQMERWHHASENINKKYITNEEVISKMYETFDLMTASTPIFTPDFLYTALMELNIADTASVQRHDFTLEAAQVSLEGFQLLAYKLKDFPESLQEWLFTIAHAGIYYVQQLAISEEEKQQKLHKVEEVVVNTANHIRNLKPAVKERIITLFEGRDMRSKHKLQVTRKEDVRMAA